MVEATGGSGAQEIDTSNPLGILKQGHVDHDARVHFDEHEIAEYDKQRGQCMKIDDPKTPVHEEDEDSDSQQAQKDEVEELDPELKEHLDEA